MKKSIIINNPRAVNYLVKINLKQNVNLFLDKELFPEPTLEKKSDYLFVEKKENFFTINHNTESIKHYQNFSNFYLGEIKIKSNKNNSNLIFVLNSTNLLKNNFLTILNPKKTQIKIVPGDILEFVLLDNFLTNDKVSWTFSYKNQCFFDVLDESFFGKNQSNDPQDFSYSKISRSKNKNHTQKHIWFGLNKNAFKFLESDIGTQNVANLTFFCKRTNSFFDCDIFVNFNKKYKLKFLNSLLMSKSTQKPRHAIAKIKKINFDTLERDCNFLPASQNNRKITSYYDFLE